MTSVNENATYHLVELNGTRIAVPIAERRIKVFKKRHEDEPDPRSATGSEHTRIQVVTDDGGPVFSGKCCI